MTDEHTEARTIFAPNPGGRRPERNPAPQPSQPAPQAPPRAAPRPAAPEERRLGVNPLVDAAGELLELAAYLRAQTRPIEPQGLRAKLNALLRDFKRRASTAGIDEETARRAVFCVAALIDDIIMSSPWNREAHWQQKTLVSTEYGHVDAGETFYKLLELVQSDPRGSRDLMELMYICLSLGFKGYFHLKADVSDLEARRAAVFRDIDAQRDGLKDALSPNWRGVEVERERLRYHPPFWLLAALSAAAMAVVFLIFSWMIDLALRPSHVLAAAVPPQGAVSIEKPTPSERQVTEPLPPEVNPSQRQIETVASLLQGLIDEGVIAPLETRGTHMLIRVRSQRNDGTVMFRSGSAEVSAEYNRDIQRIARALAQETQGDIQVLGHADSTPHGGGPPHYSNQGLSEARARQVAQILANTLGQPQRALTYAGLDDKYPIADNATREGRADNRRIELLTPLSGAGGR